MASDRMSSERAGAAAPGSFLGLMSATCIDHAEPHRLSECPDTGGLHLWRGLPREGEELCTAPPLLETTPAWTCTWGWISAGACVWFE